MRHRIDNSRYWNTITKNRNLSWEVISTEIGMSVSGIFASIRCNRTLNLEKTWKLVKLLGISLDDLSDYTEYITRFPETDISYERGETFAEMFWNTADAIRKSMDLSWAEVGKVALLPPSTISTARTRHYVPSYQQASALVNAGLHCSMTAVFNLMYGDELKIVAEQKEISNLATRIMQLPEKDRLFVSDMISRLLDE